MKLRDYIDAQRGRAAEMARALRINPTLISQWASTREVPAERCPAIEKATGGAVRCEDLRPDVDWAYLRATDCPVNVGAGETAGGVHASHDAAAVRCACENGMGQAAQKVA